MKSIPGVCKINSGDGLRYDPTCWEITACNGRAICFVKIVSFRLLALVESSISESWGEAFKTARTPAVSETVEKSGTAHIRVTATTTPSPATISKRQVSRPCQKARIMVGGMKDFLGDEGGGSWREVMVATRC